MLSFLPPLPDGAVWWTVFWILTLAYPLLFYPYLRSRRADYTFRLLHFLPMIFVILWLLLALISFYIPQLTRVSQWYEWGFSVGPVLVGCVLIIMFSLHVVRQRVQRVLFLVLFCTVFFINAYAWELHLKPADQLAMAPSQDEEVVNLSASDDPEEESWRKKLRRMERKQKRLEDGEFIHEIPVQSVSSAASFSSKPPELTSSGSAIVEVAALLFLAAYGTVLQRRASRR